MIRLEATLTYHLDPELLTRGKKIQSEEDYQRNVDGNYEPAPYLPGSTVRFWINDNTEEFATHWHPATELIFPLENGYTVTVGQETYELSPGDIFVIPPGELHHLVAPPSGERLILMFDLSVLGKIRGFSYLTSFLSQPILINRDTYSNIYARESEIVLRLVEHYFSNSSMRDLNIYSLLMSFFVTYVDQQLARGDSGDQPPLTPKKHKDLMDKLNSVFNYIDEHYAENITLEVVADVAGFSKFHFSRLFKQCSGYNFYDYLCFRRIKSAENLLLHPEMSITEVALQSGFSSLSTFNRTFKKLKNCTPSEYRSLSDRQM